MQVITILLERDSKIEKFRQKKDEETHITIVYPFKVEGVGEHISKVIKDFKKFKIGLKGIARSERGEYVYLLVEKGKEKVVKLHENLCTGILKDADNPEMPEYVPHLSLGEFGMDEDLDKFESLSLELEVDCISLLTLNKGKIIFRKDFFLD